MSNLNPPSQKLIEKLKSVCGQNGWLDPANSARHLEDPRDRFTGKASIILLPTATSQVADIISFCNNAAVGIVPYSGGTGVVAGQLSPDCSHYVVLSLEKMNTIRNISTTDEVIVAEAGCVLADVQSLANENHRLFPLSMASQGSCCIGGNLATNAGGIQVLRYGNARDQCLGIEAVLPDGTILDDLKPLRKNNTGYDLRNLLIGSEGTLGIITAATLKLAPLPPETHTVLCAIASPSDAVSLLRSIRTEVGDTISACELMSGFGMDLLVKHFPTQRYPFRRHHPWFALIEASGPKDTTKLLENALQQCIDNELVIDAVVAQSRSQSIDLWNLREMTPEANRKEGAICNSDTSVPIGNIEKFIRLTESAIHNIDPAMRINCYGHIGDGNIHFNIFPPVETPKPDYIAKLPNIREDVRMAINETTDECGGSISAEHGIGRLKTEDLAEYGNQVKLATMRSIKHAIDPNGIMNPGAIFPI